MKYYLLSLLLFPVVVLGQTVSPPVLSHESGFYTDEFYLTISHPDPDVTILYTLDGSEPKIENLTGKVWNYKKQYPTNPGDPVGDLLQDTIWTYEYNNPILVKDQSNEQDKYADVSTSYYTNYWYNSMAKQDSINVFKGLVLNVATYHNGTYSKVITKNYFVSHEGNNRYSLPVTCLNIDPEKFFSYETGLNVPGILFDEWRSQNSSQPIDRMWAPANFRASGSESEIPLNFTYIVNGQQVLNHGAGLRLHGNGSRYFPNRSYRLYAKSGYGASNFNYPFFSDYSESNFKRIILRNSGNDCVKTMFRDAFIQQASKNLNFDIQEYQPSILFINGEYFGLYNIRERFDDKYFEQVYSINVDDLDFLENMGDVQEGDNLSYNSLIDFLENNSLADDVNYNYVSELVDIVNFTDYYITEIFISNIDWPTNNIEYWRKRVPYNSNAPYGHDGRWRWVLKDLDYSFGYRWDNKTYDYDDLSLLSTISDSDATLNRATIIFRSLLENELYRVYFINRFSDILNTTYQSELLVSKINELRNRIFPEMQEFIDRWSPTNEHLLSYHPVHSSSTWEENIGVMETFAQHRPYWTRNHIQNRFETGDQINLVLGISNRTEGYIELNSILIKEGTDGINSSSPYPWSGVYFEAVPITLKAIPEPGYKFSHWSGEIYDTIAAITINIDRDTYIKANFIPDTGDLSVDDLTITNKHVEIYPNPFTGKINVLADNYEGEYHVYSLEGKLIKQGDFNTPTIYLEELPKGIFTLKIFSDNMVIRKQIIKQ